MHTAVIIQARTRSERLPGKVLLKVKNKPLVVHTINRIKRCQEADGVILATSDREEDRILLDIAREKGIHGFAGSERNVLDRFYQAARLFEVENIVRCTGDCPMVDPEITDQVIRRHYEKKCDFTTNALIRSFPRGYDTEVVKFSALEVAAHKATQPYEQEHVMPYIFEHPDQFSIEHVIAESHHYWPELRLTVDTLDDYRLIEAIFTALYDQNPYFEIDEVLQLLRQKPELAQINAHIQQKTAHSAQKQ